MKKIFLSLYCILIAIVLFSCGDKEQGDDPTPGPGGEHQHNFLSTWEFDADEHWHECSCGEKSEVGSHDLTDWTTTTPPTEDEVGKKERHCEICAYEEEAEVPKLDHKHQFGTDWKFDGSGHWHECRCGEVDEVIEHELDDTLTCICGYQKFTEGLEYQVDPNGEFMVVSGIGEAKDKDIYLPATYKDLPVTIIAAGAFKENTDIESIHIGKNIEKIEGYAFMGASNLMRIYIPEGVDMEINATAFGGCARLVEIFNASNMEFEKGSFDHGSIAKNALIIHDSLSAKSQLKVEDGFYFFNDGKTNLLLGDDGHVAETGEAILPDNLEYKINKEAFASKKNLRKVIIGNMCTEIGDKAFWYCENLRVVQIGRNVKKIGKNVWEKVDRIYELINLSGLTSRLPSAINKYTSTNYTSTYFVENDFEFCLDSSRNYRMIGYIGSAEDLVLPSKIRGSDYKIHEDSFNGNETIKTLKISGNIIVYQAAFKNCINLEYVEWNSKYSPGNSCFAGCVKLEEVVFGSNALSIDGAYAFSGCTNLKRIVVPSGIREMPKDTTFGGCYNLVEAWNYTGYSLKEYIPSLLVEHKSSSEKTSIFENAGFDWLKTNNNEYYLLWTTNKNAQELILPSKINGQKYLIKEYAFANMPNLKKVIISNGVILAEEIFSRCQNLEEVILPSDLKVLPKSIFYGCTSLKTIKLPDTLTTIEEDAFWDSGIEEIIIPDSVTSFDGFRDCDNLEELIIPDGITTLKGFENCSNLKRIVIPGSVKKIEDYLFNDIESLEVIEFNGTEKEWENLVRFYKGDKTVFDNLEIIFNK